MESRATYENMAHIDRLRAFEGRLCAFGLLGIFLVVALALALALAGVGVDVFLCHCKRVGLLFTLLDDVGCASGCKAENDVSLHPRLSCNSFKTWTSDVIVEYNIILAHHLNLNYHLFSN